MASFRQHRLDCLRFLGGEYPEVNAWLDECFSKLGPYHRKARHHREGLDEIRELFGASAVKAGIVHILRDCRHIPRRIDYETGIVDALGLKQSWSTAAYIKYSDLDFEELVEQQFKPTGLVLWAFLAWNDVRSFLASLTRYSPEEIEDLQSAWQNAHSRLENDIPLVDSGSSFISLQDMKDISLEAAAYLRETLEVPIEGSVGEQQDIAVGYVPISLLTSPLVYIDYELLEELKPELAGTSQMDILRFALPRVIQSNIKAVGDPGQRSVTFISNQKTTRVSNVRLRSTPEGTEVSYLVSASGSGIVVGDLGDRLLLRNGIHRAYLLAQLGVKEVPCVFIKERNPIPLVVTSYPTFSPQVLVQPRQPMLSDFFKPELCIQAPMQKTHRIIRISADDTLIPVD